MPGMESVNWSDMTAIGAVIFLVIWLITIAAPNLLNRFSETVAKQQESFSEELRRQRTEFRDELSAHRDQSRMLAGEGHAAVEKLATAFDELDKTIRETIAQNA